MPPTLDQILRSVPPAEWMIEYNIIFDWYDGEREGWCRLSYPACSFSYKIQAEILTGPGLHDCLLAVRPVPADAIERLLTVLDPLSPDDPEWFGGFWPYDDPNAIGQAEAMLATLMAESGAVCGYLQGRNLEDIKAYWTHIEQ
jgi:hypothetical protein